MNQSSHWSKIEGSSQTQLARVMVVSGVWNQPINSDGHSPLHHLELNLLPVPGGTQARFADRWSPQQFVQAGEVFFLPANQRVQFRSNCRQQNSVVCKFDPEVLEQWIRPELDWDDALLRNTLNIGSKRIRQLLFELSHEIRNPGFASHTVQELMVSQIAIELVRFLKDKKERASVPGGLSLENLRLIDLRLQILESQPSLEELAELCDLSVRHLSRAFRVSRGKSLGVYMAEQRMHSARQMIASGRSIKSVAYDCGFSAPSNFTATFKRVVGESPSQYQRRVLS